MLTLKSLVVIYVELFRQLDTWYMPLPDATRPDFNSDVPFDLHDGWLRLRYWSHPGVLGSMRVDMVCCFDAIYITLDAGGTVGHNVRRQLLSILERKGI